ncbi:MAG: hypothetical protein DWQ35_12255 [Planctomycetota bacterium]|nr:MAG: hypothetical protein DWQ35_12255 [Planctomycetota bacterium]REK18117.1 MAG: hypothetical protein DWQ42_20810 [Planctomycetota bacterium]REK44215.1 MAG: hypothetical protein DWQ46_10535 [Planctomycetota bacterium]
MPPPPTPAKQRASRIALTYYSKPDALTLWKVAAAGLALCAALGWVAYGALVPDEGAARVSHGPLCQAHATWDTQCDACHVDFQPIRADAWAVAWYKSAADRADLDRGCRRCHAGPAHHAAQIPAEVGTCASCHQDHRGRQADIRRVADQHCLACHRLPADHSQRKPDLLAVTSFSADGHPEFRSLKTDPGRIKFTHKRHHAAGCVLHPDDMVQKKLADLDPAVRDRYRQQGQSDQDLVQLDCHSCHRLDPADATATAGDASWAAHGSGAYYLPISFDQHCQACHELSYEAGTAKPVPHGLTAAQIDVFLQDAYRREFLEENPATLEETLPRAVPGRAVRPAAPRGREFIDAKVRQAQKHLSNRCGQCHYFEEEAPTSLAVQAAAIPQVWMKKAVFDHAAHRAVSCRACHPRAFSDAADASVHETDVLIANRDVCLECHQPAQQEATSALQVGGARHDCVECHRYHAADQAVHGRGSPLRDGEHEFLIQEFFNAAAADQAR